MSSETFEVARNIKNFITRRAAEVIAYGNWSEQVAAQHLRMAPRDIKENEGYTAINPNDFTIEEALELGMRKWGESDTGKHLYLIPLWMHPFLVPKFKGSSITDEDGEEYTIITSEMDDDNRFGLMAYGVRL